MKPLDVFGVGAYYTIYYAVYIAALIVLAAVLRRFRAHLPGWFVFLSSALMLLFAVRLVLFDNPVALRFYSRHLNAEATGLRQMGVLELEAAKYRRNLKTPRLPYIAVGSSQVGAIFSHWVSDNADRLVVFSLAGMKPLDFVLWRREIAAYRPGTIILYLSAFDMALPPQLTTLALAPSRPLNVPATLWQLRAAGLDFGSNSAQLHQYIAAQFFPEYRYSFVFRDLFSQFLRGGTASQKAMMLDRRRPSIIPAVFVRQRGAREWLLPVSSPAAGPRISPGHIQEFVGYYSAEWLDFNFAFLRDFVAFCRAEGIQVVIAEGQVNPVLKSAKVDELNQIVRWRIDELKLRFPNVEYFPAAEIYQFHPADYADLTHVLRPAAMEYTHRLSSLLAERGFGRSCGVRFVSGWHQTEENESGWLRWTSGVGQLRVSSRESADLTLETELLSLARPNQVDVLIGGAKIATWEITDTSWQFHRMPPLRFHVNAGEPTTIELVSRTPGAAQPSDPRPLAVAVGNLTVRTAGGAAGPCDILLASSPPSDGVRL